MPARSNRVLQVLVAVPNARVARRISESLLEHRLCACAQTLGPVTSRYRWRGKIETAREWLLLVKTRAGLLPAVERAVRSLHPYEVPEILAAPVAHAHAPYARWLVAETRTPGAPAAKRASSRPARSRRPPSAR